MFEKLIELLSHGWERILPAEVVDAYEGGVVLRWGKFAREAQPGLNWKWPLAERIIAANTCVTTMRLPPQTLTTMDDVSVVVAAIVKYQIKDVKPFLIDIWDQADVLADVSAGAIKGVVSGAAYAALVGDAAGAEAAATKQVRAEVNRYGFQILKITFTDLGRVRSLRLIQPHPIDLAN